MLKFKLGKQVFFPVTEVVATRFHNLSTALIVDVKDQRQTNATLGFLLNCSSERLQEINAAVEHVQKWQYTENVQICFLKEDLYGNCLSLSPEELENFVCRNEPYRISKSTTPTYDDEFEETHYYISVIF